MEIMTAEAADPVDYRRRGQASLFAAQGSRKGRLVGLGRTCFGHVEGRHYSVATTISKRFYLNECTCCEKYWEYPGGLFAGKFGACPITS